MTHLIVQALAAARIARFITRDMLGAWTIRGPVEAWAMRHDPPQATTGPDGQVTVTPDPDQGWRSKVAAGVACPWCVTVWAAAAVTAADRATRRTPAARAAYEAVMGCLAVSWAAGALATEPWSDQ